MGTLADQGLTALSVALAELSKLDTGHTVTRLLKKHKSNKYYNDGDSYTQLNMYAAVVQWKMNHSFNPAKVWIPLDSRVITNELLCNIVHVTELPEHTIRCLLIQCLIII